MKSTQSPRTVSTLNQRIDMEYIEDDDQRGRFYHRRPSRLRGRVSWTPGSDLRKLAQDFLDAMTAQSYSPASIVHYRMTLNRLLSFLIERGRTRAQDVTTEDLEAYRLNQVERGLAAK